MNKKIEENVEWKSNEQKRKNRKNSVKLEKESRVWNKHLTSNRKTKVERKGKRENR